MNIFDDCPAPVVAGSASAWAEAHGLPPDGERRQLPGAGARAPVSLADQIGNQIQRVAVIESAGGDAKVERAVLETLRSVLRQGIG